MNTGRFVAVLNSVIAGRSVPKRIRVDNGPELVSNALDRWAYQNGVVLGFRRPGRQTDNSFIESFNRRLGKKCLIAHWILSLDDAGAKIEAWRVFYNESRPHSAPGERTPCEFASHVGANSGR